MYVQKFIDDYDQEIDIFRDGKIIWIETNGNVFELEGKDIEYFIDTLINLQNEIIAEDGKG